MMIILVYSPQKDQLQPDEVNINNFMILLSS